MPELPEVESIRKNLEAVIKGDTIQSITVYYRPIVSNDDQFESKLMNQTIHHIEREAKYLKFILDDYCLISHLRMEGKYVMDAPLTKHTHVVFHLKSGHMLQYQDTRKFGRFECIPIALNKTYLNVKKGLAKDPKHMTEVDFFDAIKDQKRSIKELLLDQKIIGGIGNIYANEILYLSKMHPARKGLTISKEQSDVILKHTKEVIDLATKLGGSTIDTFESLGHKGEFQQHLNVHGKTGSTCGICGSTIEKVQFKGRGTYYCPTCQKSVVIGLTGGIASGKTTASNYLKKLGFKVIDSDEIVKNLYEQKEVIEAIGKKFDVLEFGFLNKKKLAQIIFNQPKAKKRLESILHPMVFEAIRVSKMNSFDHLIFIDMPLLFEVGYKDIDYSLLIFSKPSTQLNRLIIRDHLTEHDALLRINSQMSILKKKKLANHTIDNNHDIPHLYQQIKTYLREVLS